VQDTGYIIINGITIKLLRRRKIDHLWTDGRSIPRTSLKVRMSGIDGRHFDDEEMAILLNDKSDEILQALSRGDTIHI
jgi:hypothetical protein